MSSDVLDKLCESFRTYHTPCVSFFDLLIKYCECLQIGGTPLVSFGHTYWIPPKLWNLRHLRCYYLRSYGTPRECHRTFGITPANIFTYKTLLVICFAIMRTPCNCVWNHRIILLNIYWNIEHLTWICMELLKTFVNVSRDFETYMNVSVSVGSIPLVNLYELMGHRW